METEASTEKTEPAVPEGVRPALTDMQRNIRALTTQGQVPPKPKALTEGSEELDVPLKMVIPVSWKRAEYVYAFKRMRENPELVSSGGIWAVATRSNHPHIPEVSFDLATGAILFGDSMLCFTWKDHRVVNHKRIRRSFEKAMDRREAEKKYYGPGGDEVAVLYPADNLKGGYGNAPGNSPVFTEESPEYDDMMD